MTQVMVIHGGNAYETYEEFLSNLWSQVISLEWLTMRDWKHGLQSQLGDEFQVLQPRMPNPQNAKYLEWKIMFEKYIPLLNDNVILVGHSLGGSFLGKYLSEEIFPKKIVATFFVSAPYNIDSRRKLPEFSMPISLEKLKAQGGQLFFYHSKDDPIVAFDELAKFQQQLNHAHTETFEDRQHFNQDLFPEIVRDIKGVATSV